MAHWKELEQAWRTVLGTFQDIYEKYAPAEEKTEITDGSELLQLPQEKLDEMAAWIDDFKTDAALIQIKEWLKSPLDQDMRKRLTDVLAAIEDEFDEDKAMMILKKNTEDNIL